MRSEPSPGDLLPRIIKDAQNNLRDLGNRIAMLAKRTAELERLIDDDPLLVMTRPSGAADLESPRTTILGENMVKTLILDVPSGTDTTIHLLLNGNDTGISVTTARGVASGYKLVLKDRDKLSIYCADLGFTLVASIWN